MATDIGNYLREIRGKRSLRNISELTGVSHTHLSDIEKGKDRRTGKTMIPSPDALKKIADGTGADYLEMLKLAGYLSDLKFRREKSKEDTLLRIEEEGIIDPGIQLTILNKNLSDRIQNGGKNHKVTFNGQPLTIEELEYIESILIEFASINISEYSVDALKNIDEGFRELLSKYRSDK